MITAICHKVSVLLGNDHSTSQKAPLALEHLFTWKQQKTYALYSVLTFNIFPNLFYLLVCSTLSGIAVACARRLFDQTPIARHRM